MHFVSLCQDDASEYSASFAKLMYSSVPEVAVSICACLEKAANSRLPLVHSTPGGPVCGRERSPYVHGPRHGHTVPNDTGQFHSGVMFTLLTAVCVLELAPYCFVRQLRSWPATCARCQQM